MELVDYKGWKQSVRLANEAIELIALTVAGPRIIRAGFLGGENLLHELPDTLGKIGEADQWTPYGGHRLWHGPEAMPRSYSPDNTPVEASVDQQGTLHLVAETEPSTKIQKEMRITIGAGESTAVRVEHLLTNWNLWTVELAPWALTVVAPSGRVILPQEPYSAHGTEGYLPARPMALWPYTDMSDPRWRWGRRFVQLYSDTRLTSPQKIGLFAGEGWGAYARAASNELMLVFSQPDPRGASAYADFGSSYEAYTAGDFQELETLGPLSRLDPAGFVGHTEYWVLFKNAALPDSDDGLEEAMPEWIGHGRAAVQESFFSGPLRPKSVPEETRTPVRLPSLSEK